MGVHDANAEVTRYITWPAQATAYKVAERCIRKMRTLAETELKEKFDPRDFYDAVLRCGPIPLNVLEDIVKEYIDNDGKVPMSQRGVTTPSSAFSIRTIETGECSTFAGPRRDTSCCRCFTRAIRRLFIRGNRKEPEKIAS